MKLGLVHGIAIRSHIFEVIRIWKPTFGKLNMLGLLTVTLLQKETEIPYSSKDELSRYRTRRNG